MYEIIGYLDFEIVVGQFVVISVMVTVVPVAILYNTVAGYILCFTVLMELPTNVAKGPEIATGTTCPRNDRWGHYVSSQ